MPGEYFYKNKTDTVRVAIRQGMTGGVPEGTWNADLFFRSGRVTDLAHEGASLFYTKREVKKHIESMFGKLISIQTKTLTEGW